jgi:hypothetical protein
MVVLYVGGKPVGALPDADNVLSSLAAKGQEAEVRDEAGTPLGKFVPPGDEPLCPWYPQLTRADLDRMSAEGGGVPPAEFWTRMGVA